jgi:hypothetical protein
MKENWMDDVIPAAINAADDYAFSLGRLRYDVQRGDRSIIGAIMEAFAMGYELGDFYTLHAEEQIAAERRPRIVRYRERP